jgi:hypothetical protein
MRILLTALFALLACVSALEAKTLGFTAAFPDERVRGKAYELSDSDYSQARSMGTVILEKNEELFGSKLDRSGDVETRMKRWNRLRAENNERMDELHDFLRRNGTRVR